MGMKPVETVDQEPCAGAGADGAMSPPLFERLMALARISSLEEMANGIAHDLNQPLGAIATYAQAGERMLNRLQPMVPQAGEVFKQITDAALNAGEDIRRIRKLFNRDAPHMEECALPELLDELRPLLQALAHRAQVALDIAIEPGPPLIHADRLRIQHVLFTLAQNAFEASAGQPGAGAVRIRVRGERYALVVEVEDSGCGIPAEAGEQIFRPFFTTKPQGTGLALATSRAIIEAHGGTVGFESTPGAGTRFWFHLPVVVESRT